MAGRRRIRSGWAALVAWALPLGLGAAVWNGWLTLPDRWNPWAPLWPQEAPNLLTAYKLGRLADVRSPAARAARDDPRLRAAPRPAARRRVGSRDAVRVSALPAAWPAARPHLPGRGGAVDVGTAHGATGCPRGVRRARRRLRALRQLCVPRHRRRPRRSARAAQRTRDRQRVRRRRLRPRQRHDIGIAATGRAAGRGPATRSRRARRRLPALERRPRAGLQRGAPRPSPPRPRRPSRLPLSAGHRPAPTTPAERRQCGPSPSGTGGPAKGVTWPRDRFDD